MTVSLRVKRSEKPATRRRSRDGREPARRAEQAAVPLGSPPPPAQAPAAQTRKIPPPPQDRALYACSCGYVFSQEVSTSVACPHCGDTQAW